MENLQLCLPLAALWVTSSSMLGFFTRNRPDGTTPATRFAAAGLTLAALFTLVVWPAADTSPSTFHGLLLLDPLAAIASLVVILAGLVTLGFARDWFLRASWNLPEIPLLIVLATSGMVIMVSSDHLGVIFLGLEIMSLSLYVLSGSMRSRKTSIEAGTKYYLTGAFASGIFLMGIALSFGASGSFTLSGMGAGAAAGNPLALSGLILLLVGFAFKVSAAPFHQWTPDVYEGAPTPITGFMATAVKFVGFTALLRVVAGMGVLDEQLYVALGWLAVVTMLVGNIGALAQKSVKRMLAYSSISHAGYLLLGLAAMATSRASDTAAAVSPTGAVLFYLITYAIMNLGAFGILALMEAREGGKLDHDDLAGLKDRQPLLAAGMCVFMLSLAGVPPMAGFLAKWKIFEVLAQNFQSPQGPFFIFLSLMLILTSLLGLTYYLRVIVAMYMTAPPENAPASPAAAPLSLTLVLTCAALTLWLGFAPNLFGLGPEGLLMWVQQAH